MAFIYSDSLFGIIPRNYRKKSWVTGNVHALMINELFDCVSWISDKLALKAAVRQSLGKMLYITISAYANFRSPMCAFDHVNKHQLMNAHLWQFFASLWYHEENKDHVLNRKSELLNLYEHLVFWDYLLPIFFFFKLVSLYTLTTHSEFSPTDPLYSGVSRLHCLELWRTLSKWHVSFPEEWSSSVFDPSRKLAICCYKSCVTL